MSFVISFCFLAALLQAILVNHQGQSLFSGQSIDIDVAGDIENGLFLLPASVTSGAVNLIDRHKNDSLSSISSSNSITTYYSSFSSSQPISVKASFGTITTTETVFPYVGPHDTYSYLKNQLKTNGLNKSNKAFPKNFMNGASLREKITDSTLVEINPAHGKHSIAYLITPQVNRNSPVIRVLFYTTHAVIHSSPTVTSPTKDETGSNSNSKSNNSGEGVNHGGNPSNEASPCIFVSVSKDGDNLIGSCTPINNREGACLVEITLPAYWWPPVELDSASPKSRKPALVSVDYKTFHTYQCTENGSLLNDNIKRLKSLTDAFTHLGIVTLSPFTGGYEEVTNDDIVRILIPQQITYPNNKIYIPVCFRYNPNYPMTAFRLRARVKSGLRILGVQPSPVSPWKISVELNSKQTLATVTAKLKDDLMDSEDLQSGDPGMHLLLSQEIYSWLIQVNENVDFNDNGRIVWQLEYVTDIGFDSATLDSSSSTSRKDSERDTSKLSSILDIQKDDIQAVIGITQSLSMINTAILTGKQVAQSLRVFAVSQAGRIGDVTLQASCTSTDESVLKVSPSCTSIYLDGSEIRGSSNATISIKYGTYTGQANFVVWMPKLPLEVRVSDSKLSQIKGWKIPHLKREGRRSYHNQNSIYGHSNHKSRRSSAKNSPNDKIDYSSTDNDIGCRLRHQQAYIQVFSRFFSTDHNSGRESYLLNRKVLAQVTKLVTPFLRVTDSRVAIIRSNIIEGISSGRTEIQIVSPITNQILGSTEIHVGNDKEMITQLEVNLVTGLSLSITPESSLTNVWKITANISSKLVNQYQEGLLNIKVHFSDDTVTSLADINDSDYQLSINTLDNGGIAYAPLIGQPYPRVIVIGQGNSQLHVSLEVSDQCQRKLTQPLAMSYINANVDLNLPSVHLQNDADFRKYNGILVNRNQNSFHPNHPDDEDSSIAYGHSNIIESHPNAPSIEARSNRAINTGELTPLEVGMYSMLGVFTLAVSLFIISCLVFRIKGKQTSDLMVATLPLPMGHHGSSSNQKVVANANDWIWLGKATLQRSSPPSSTKNDSEASQGLISLNDLKNPENHHLNVTKENDSNRMSTISHPGSEISIRITTNPVDEVCLENEATPKPSTPFGINMEIERFYRSLSPIIPSTSNQIPPPVPARRTKGPPTSHHITPPQKEPLFDTCAPIIIPNHKPPHIPPRLTRSIRCDQVADSSSSSSSFSSQSPRPPPVPPHSVTSRTTKKPPLPPHRTVPSKPKRPVISSTTSNINNDNEQMNPTCFKNTKDHRKYNKEVNHSIIVNPSSALTEMTQDKLDKVTKDMNYNQLMEYFQNLKESSA
ncbi:transmembrane protein 132C-like [Tetranychus urticae]|uniref:transmembrane protein 132C-like n=1 Tax=Tetranychus urticae TaxID=32264 RepID=UPI000D6516E2|nr:transmembrane protein 132C-like [Tetranychus urticae]